MIEIRNLTKTFNTFKALDALNITVNKGEIYGFIGRNGAGKSTTMNIIAGLSKQDAGTCVVNGISVSSIHHPSELNIGYLPENPNFQGWLTAFETLLFITTNPTSETVKRIHTLLDWVGLEKHKKRRVGGFSRGMKQRLGLACALIHDPELLILDEPSSALDPEGRSDVLALILDLKKQGKTIIFSTHILSDVERMCDRIGLIHGGKCVLETDLDTLMHANNKPILDIDYEGAIDASIYETIRRIPSVFQVDVLKNKIALHIEDKANVHTVMKHVVALEFSMLGLTLRKNTLEDLFIKEVNGK